MIGLEDGLQRHIVSAGGQGVGEGLGVRMGNYPVFAASQEQEPPLRVILCKVDGVKRMPVFWILRRGLGQHAKEKLHGYPISTFQKG